MGMVPYVLLGGTFLNFKDDSYEVVGGTFNYGVAPQMVMGLTFVHLRGYF